MIHVPRDPQTPNLDVFNKNTTTAPDGQKKPKAVAETEKMVAFFTDPNHFQNDEKVLNSPSSPTFTAYKNDVLVDLLLGLFHEKCAYCESRFPATSNEDIEHFRPKKRIDSGSKKLQPGYYWLGADWNNLLVSCQLCNRRQFHHTPDDDDEVKLGKQDLFPLADETQRVRSHTDSVDYEESHRLLINPCIEADPSRFFEFDEDGRIRSATQSGKRHDMAMASIATYALQRAPLVDERAREFKDVRRQFRRIRDRVEDMVEALDSGDAGEIAESQGDLDEEMDALTDLFEVKSPYLAMKRKLLKEALDAGEFGDLTAAGLDLTMMLEDFEKQG